MKIAVIGSGVLGSLAAFWAKNAGHHVTLFDAEEFIPKTTLRTTSIVALRGTKRGLSPLGDLICDSFQSFEVFFKKYQPHGVEVGSETVLWRTDMKDKYQKRYPQSFKLSSFEELVFRQELNSCTSNVYHIYPTEFLKWLNADLEIANELVLKVSEGTVFTMESEQTFDHVLFANSHGINSVQAAHNEETLQYLSKCSTVKGDYFYFDYNPTAFSNHSFEFEGVHLIFRKDHMLVGSSSDKVDHLLFHKKSERIFDHLENFIDFEFPKKREFISGLRQKGAKRTPFCYVDQYQSYLLGGYKNAFLFAPHLAKIWLKELEKAFL